MFCAGSTLEQHSLTADGPGNFCKRLQDNNELRAACQSNPFVSISSHEDNALPARAGKAEEAGQQAEEGQQSGAAVPGCRASCDVVSSDYRFVYSGCKVQLDIIRFA